MPSRTYAGLGPDTLVPRLKPAALGALKIGAEEGFVLSRVDGRLTVAQICLLVPFESHKTAEMLAQLQRAGAIEIPGSDVARILEEPLTPPPHAAPPPVAPPPRSTPPAANVTPPSEPPRARVTTPPSTPKPPRENRPTPTSQPSRAPVNVPPPAIEGLDLTLEQARRIDEFFFTLDVRDAFELLEIGRGADKKEIKRAYYKMSKEFHPDRFFNKNLGPYKDRLSKIFQSLKAAFELLNDDARRAAYEESQK